jgi:hypothetical protein
VPPPGVRGGLGRLRERLNKVVTESVPMDGHGNGYGGHGNGHGDGHHEAEPEHVVVPSGGHEEGSQTGMSAPEADDGREDGPGQS